MAENNMRRIRIEKLTLNIGSGEAGQKLENAKELLKRVSGVTPVVTKARIRAPAFKIKKGDPIGAKVTVRGPSAADLLKRALEAVDHKVKAVSFDKEGNVSFGVREYIDFPGVKYDPKIGMIGFDVCVTLKRPGWRVVHRRRAKAWKIGDAHRVTPEEAQTFLKEGFKVEVV